MQFDPLNAGLNKNSKGGKKCKICGERTIQTCAGCLKVYYCSREHQKEDWKKHKKACKSSRHNQHQHQNNSKPSTSSNCKEGLIHPSSWARGLKSPMKYEWLLDVYRMRIDETYVYRGDAIAMYNPDSSKFDILTHFWIFCKLCARRGVIPTQKWNWNKFLDVASEGLMYAFQKSDAEEKYDGEDVMDAQLGGRSLQATAEYVYGGSPGLWCCETADEEAQELEEKVEKWKESLDDDIDEEADIEEFDEDMLCVFWSNEKRFLDVGGISAWRQLMSLLPERNLHY
eukprot:TRINITY_DN3270_c0_g1_i3.p2 TRINITY_DN3270_c0_g1~~TRINITY_DN3270_c0_g1_i3.p2  ORF type:complete len:285 (+),score=57.05 TRINITY_DN3270_c0_g1_i3:71-925(+)